MYVARSI